MWTHLAAVNLRHALHLLQQVLLLVRPVLQAGQLPGQPPSLLLPVPELEKSSFRSVFS